MPLVTAQGGSSVHAYFVRTEAGVTRAVLGKIEPVGTSGRPTPPQPASGFNTAYTPFGNGHVFALSLGGSDNAHNIVPQWEQWQQTGTWRKQEEACEKLSGGIFLAEVDYDPSAADTYDQTKDDFATNRFVGWSDPRLPVAFRIRVFNPAAAAYPAALAGEGAFDAFAGALVLASPVFDTGTLSHAAMPPEDRRYWQGQRLIEAAYTCHDNHDAKTGARSDLVDYLMSPKALSQLRDEIGRKDGFTVTEREGLKMQDVLRATISMPKARMRKLIATYETDHEALQTSTARRKADARAAQVAQGKAARQNAVMQRRMQSAALNT